METVRPLIAGCTLELVREDWDHSLVPIFSLRKYKGEKALLLQWFHIRNPKYVIGGVSSLGHIVYGYSEIASKELKKELSDKTHELYSGSLCEITL